MLTFRNPTGLADGDPGMQDAAIASLRASGLLGVSGALTTNATSGQQWDAPNAWAPLQEMLIGECGKFAPTLAPTTSMWLLTTLNNSLRFQMSTLSMAITA